MGLYLVESVLNQEVREQVSLEKKITELQQKLQGAHATLIEIQVSKDFSRAFFIVESEERNSLNEGFRSVELPISLVKAVQLIGQDLDEVKKQADAVNYLVEWNLPENLTMEAYLDRKKTNSVHYAEVPEVSFSRTYVCEDMTKCLCFYDAPNISTVKKAREAVQAPVDVITEIFKK